VIDCILISDLSDFDMFGLEESTRDGFLAGSF